MSATPAPAPFPTIEFDLRCVTCGYNLRTVPTEGRCPECGAPAIDSVRAYAARLGSADPRWLRGLARGLLWLVLSMLVPVGALFVKPPLFDSEGWRSSERLRLGIVLTSAVLGIVACWRLGTAQPRRGDDDALGRGGDQPFVRWALRVTAIAWIVPLLVYAGPFTRRIYDRSPRAVDLLLGIVGWAGLPATILVVVRLKQIARRIPSRALILQCAFLLSQLPLTLLLISMLTLRRFEEEPDAYKYVVTTVSPGAGLPWPLALHADGLWWVGLDDLSDARFLIFGWLALVSLALLVVAIEFWVAVLLIYRTRDRHGPGAAGRGLSPAARTDFDALSRVEPRPPDPAR